MLGWESDSTRHDLFLQERRQPGRNAIGLLRWAWQRPFWAETGSLQAPSWKSLQGCQCLTSSLFCLRSRLR